MIHNATTSQQIQSWQGGLVGERKSIGKSKGTSSFFGVVKSKEDILDRAGYGYTMYVKRIAGARNLTSLSSSISVCSPATSHAMSIRLLPRLLALWASLDHPHLSTRQEQSQNLLEHLSGYWSAPSRLTFCRRHCSHRHLSCQELHLRRLQAFGFDEMRLLG